MKIGFIGQGWIGKHYANDFEARGYSVVRYALEEPHVYNREKIQDCEVVFVAVPTPTTTNGFDASIVHEALQLVGKGSIVVIKSTLIPGTTRSLQQAYPELYVLNSPEFLVEKTAAHDAANPKRNLVGIPSDTKEYREKAQMIVDILPPAPYTAILSAETAELVKYAGNCFLFTKVVFMNLLYDLSKQLGVEWEVLREALIHDERIGSSHTKPVYDDGRGAGGHCFIKDFEAFKNLYRDVAGDTLGDAVLNSLAEKNIELLKHSNKDTGLLQGVYG